MPIEETPVLSAADRDGVGAAILPSDAAGGIAVVAVIVVGDAPFDVGSPPHRAEATSARPGPAVISAADGVGALRCC